MNANEKAKIWTKLKIRYGLMSHVLLTRNEELRASYTDSGGILNGPAHVICVWLWLDGCIRAVSHSTDGHIPLFAMHFVALLASRHGLQFGFRLESKPGKKE